MLKRKNIIFTLALALVAMLNPACKHGRKDDAMAIYQRYVLKHTLPVKAK